jgi:signal peptidase I
MDKNDIDSDLEDDLLTDETEPMTFGHWLWDIIKTWGPAVFAVFFIRSAIAEPFRIPSGSMVPTLAIGDHILVTKFSYGLRIPLTRIPIGSLSAPERGDVVVFVYPGSDENPDGSFSPAHYIDLPFPPFSTLDYVKRVVGLPGDRISVRDNVLYINGKKQEKVFVNNEQFIDDRCRSHETKQYREKLGDHEHSMLNASRSMLRMGDYPETLIPEGKVFVMGDNRDHSSDSRVWGMVPLWNIKGKARFIWLSYDQCKGGMPVLGSIRSERFGIPVE